MLDYTNFARTPKSIHFVGISGIGMGALAQLCLERGWHVRGSTQAHNAMTHHLMAMGAAITDHHSGENLDVATDCVVYSTAIAQDNPEIQTAHNRGIPVVHRSDLLRALVTPLTTIAISGTHGKTTTTSLLGHVLYAANQDPLIISGGMMGAWNSPVYAGKGPIAIVEADESDQSHIHFSTLSGAILTNVEAEHMDSYGGSLEKLWQSHEKFLGLAQDFAIVCQDANAVTRTRSTLNSNLKAQLRLMATSSVNLASLIYAQSLAQNVPPAIALAVAQQESGISQWTPSGNLVTGTSGEIGVFQIMPATAQGLGVDPTDVDQNISGGISLLSQLYE